MQRAILVLSKDASLIEMIRSNFEEGGRYYVQGVMSVHSALAMIRHHPFDLAILDLDQTESTTAQWIHHLKALQPELKILVYDHLGPASDEPFITPPVDGFIKRPFFAPELSNQLRSLFSSEGSTLKATQTTGPESSAAELMFQDSNLDFVAITSLLEKTSATAVMTFIQGTAGAKTNSMSPIVAQKITKMISPLLANYKGTDFCLFLKAENELDACMVYSMPLTPNVTLAFTYPAGSDLRLIRQETTHLKDAFMIGRYSVRELDDIYPSSIPVDDQEFQRMESRFSEEENFSNRPSMDENASQWVLEMDDVHPDPFPPALEEIMQSFPPLSEDLGSQVQLSDTQPVRVSRPKESPSLEFNKEAGSQLPELKSVIEENIRQIQTPVPEAEPPVQTSNVAAEKGLPIASAANEIVPAEDVLATAMAAQDDVFRELPATGKSCNTYHCVIIPDPSHHLLTREWGEQVASLIRRYHQMNGWELLRLTIRPQYAMWTVNLPVSNNPIKIVEEIKAETSHLLLTSVPEQTPTAEDDSFWAAGYWILSGQYPPSGSLIKQILTLIARKSAGSPDSIQ